MTRAVRVTVLGGGSWGTTVAALAAMNTPTTLWARDGAVVAEVNAEHRNARFLGERDLPSTLEATTDLQVACESADVLVVAIPSHALRGVMQEAAEHVRAWVPVLSLSKGLEQQTRMRCTEIIAECLPGHPVGILAGPNLAREVLDGMAAAAVVATPDVAVAQALQPLFWNERFRVYRNTDVLGSELGGALKNVIAIASGMADGLGVGDNTRALVITRGLAEMTRLGEAMGADPKTFMGLTGMGDLLATCASPLSRNRRVGEGLAQNKTVEDIVEEMGQVAEGIKTVGTVMELSRSLSVSMPIAEQVDRVVNDGRHPRDAYDGLRAVAAQSEHHEVA